VCQVDRWSACGSCAAYPEVEGDKTMKDCLRDAMGARKLRARWVICGKLRLETATCLKGEEETFVDMPILRDALEGKPLLSGTTLAGALRNALTERIEGYFPSDEPNEVVCLFGAKRESEEGGQSPLIVFDALSDVGAAEIRDGVAIDERYGTAAPHKKFDYEVLPRGTTFGVRVDLLVPDEENEKKLVELLGSALQTFAEEGRLGMRRSRGLGRFSVKWKAKRYDLTSRKGWLEWLKSDHTKPLPDGEFVSDIWGVLKKAAPSDWGELQPIEDRRERVVLKLALSLDGEILVRSSGPLIAAGSQKDLPDAVHLRSGGEPVLPGTSLAGVMRAHALRVAKLVLGNNECAEVLVESIFGFTKKGERGEARAQASRLRVEETLISGGGSRNSTRIAIDRFTGGVAEGALFSEQVHQGGTARVVMELRNPNPGEVGLLLLVLKDILDGWLPVGGATSVGRGVVSGKARITFADGHNAELMPGKPPQGNAADRVDKEIEALWEQFEVESDA